MSEKISAEELEAYARYGDRIVRYVHTSVSVDMVRAARAKLRSVCARIEALPGGNKGRDVIHDLWKAQSFLDDSFTPGFIRLVREKRHE